MRRALLALVLVLVTASPVFAARGLGKPDVFALSAWGADVNKVVKQQATYPGCNWNDPEPYPGDEFCIINPNHLANDCFWDIDDRGSTAGYGRFFAGTTSSATCVYYDGAIHLIGVGLLSTTPDLAVTVTYTPGLSFQITPTPYTLDERWTWFYQGCIVGPRYQPTDPLVTTIPGSNGGYGVPTTVSVSISNPLDQRPKETTSGGVAFGSSEPSRREAYCRGGGYGEWFAGPDGSVWATGL